MTRAEFFLFPAQPFAKMLGNVTPICSYGYYGRPFQYDANPNRRQLQSHPDFICAVYWKQGNQLSVNLRVHKQSDNSYFRRPFNPTKIHVDGELAHLKCLRQMFPLLRIILCIFHVFANIKQYVKNFKLSDNLTTIIHVYENCTIS